MNVRTVLFAASRKYFAMCLVILACYATSFIASYLLPAAVVCLAASLLFAGAGVLCSRKEMKTEKRTASSLAAQAAPAERN